MAIAHFGSVKTALDNLDAKALHRLRDTARKAETIYLCGNGGSFAVAQHWAVDLSHRSLRKAVALGSNAALLSARTNDEGHEYGVNGELITWAKPGDLLICLSCSGTSPNVRAALSVAHELGCHTVLLTGTVNDDLSKADQIIRVWSQDYAVIEDCFSVIGHWLAKELR